MGENSLSSPVGFFNLVCNPHRDFPFIIQTLRVDNVHCRQVAPTMPLGSVVTLGPLRRVSDTLVICSQAWALSACVLALGAQCFRPVQLGAVCAFPLYFMWAR